MPRKPREISSKNIYHVTCRGNNKHVIFIEEYDYIRLLQSLKKSQKKYDFKVYAYCILDNHIHLLISPQDSNLGNIVKSFSVSFVKWYNEKYQRIGHLFQGRYDSVPIESDKQFRNTVRYIIQNPVWAGASDTHTKYEWSSIGYYYEKKDSFVDADAVMEKFGSLQYFTEEMNDYSTEEIPVFQKGKRMPDNEALKVIKEISGCTTPDDFLHLNIADQQQYILQLNKKYGLYKAQLQRLCGVSMRMLNKLIGCKKRK